MYFSVEHVEFGMALSKQRKIDGKRRVFQDKWTYQYFFIKQKVCLVYNSSEPVEVTKPHTPAKQCIDGV